MRGRLFPLPRSWTVASVARWLSRLEQDLPKTVSRVRCGWLYLDKAIVHVHVHVHQYPAAETTKAPVSSRQAQHASRFFVQAIRPDA